jgi:ubiquinone/menaquinone biosynthesis C-methylase UbiE
MDKNKSIKNNQIVHDKIAKEYDKLHGEIFTTIEQNRIISKLFFAKENLKNNSLNALDIGCGSGNLSNHLLKLKFEVTSSDISKEFLKLVSMKYRKYGKKHSVFKLNGEDLSEIHSNSYDLVGTYSVLHHIPDYLKTIEEMFRVLKKGGILYLDHEVNENYWNQNNIYKEFIRKNRLGFLKKNWRIYFSFYSLKTKFKQIFNPKFRPEGDIHVFKDDHIEWNKIEKLIKDLGGKILLKEDYLLFKYGYSKTLFNHYKGKCNDYRVLIIQK